MDRFVFEFGVLERRWGVTGTKGWWGGGDWSDDVGLVIRGMGWRVHDDDFDVF